MAKEETPEKGEIDTSAPFESVKEAVSLFGVHGFWKPLPSSHASSSLASDVEDFDVGKVQEQAAELERELLLKKRDTLEVLKELEATKVLIEQIKSKLQNEESSVKLIKEDEDDKENDPNRSVQNLPEISNPGVILTELKQAKWNLTKTTNDLAEIRATVELYDKKIEQERPRSRTSMIRESDNVFTVELQRLNAEAEKYHKLGEAAKSEITKVMLQIEQTKAKIKTSEIRLVAARKMKDAARAAESIALAEIKALLEKSNDIASGFLEEDAESVTITREGYSSIQNKARDAEEFSNIEVLEGILQVDEANVSKVDIMKRVEDVMDEVKTSKKALEDALDRVEAADSAKLNGTRRRSTQNNMAKFKNPHPSTQRRDFCMRDLNGANLVGETTSPVLRPTLSIGQILSRKLFITEEFESDKNLGKRKVSLGQMLGKPKGELSSAWKLEYEGDNHKKFSVKRKKFGFARCSVLVPKQSRKIKKHTLDTS